MYLLLLILTPTYSKCLHHTRQNPHICPSLESENARHLLRTIQAARITTPRSIIDYPPKIRPRKSSISRIQKRTYLEQLLKLAQVKFILLFAPAPLETTSDQLASRKASSSGHGWSGEILERCGKPSSPSLASSLVSAFLL